MIDELSTILISSMSGTGLTGLVAAIVYYKHNKKMKALEAQLAEANVKKAHMEGKADEWHIWKEQVESLSDHNKELVERNKELVTMNAEKEDRHQEDLKECEERYRQQTLFLRDRQGELVAALEREREHVRREGVLERRIAYLLTWICKKSDCDHGIPPRERLKGHVFDESTVVEIENENNVTINLTRQC